MCKHILNAQVSVTAPCCKKWFDCPECHAETSDHSLLKVHEIVMACKACRKVFRKDSRGEMDESDEYCPYCDNHYVLPAKGPEEAMLVRAGEMVQTPMMFNDPRMKPKLLELNDIDAELEELLRE